MRAGFAVLRREANEDGFFRPIVVANLINNSYGEITESGLLGPVRLVR
jgi:hypothetical protein